MTGANGVQDGGVIANVNGQHKQEPATIQQGGGNEELEAIKKELASRDKKIQELLEADKARAEEAEKQRLASLTAEQQLAEIQSKLDNQEKRAEYLSMGLTSEQAQSVLSATSETEKAKLIFEYASAKSVEQFKQAELAKIPKEPTPKEIIQNDPLMEAVKRDLGI